MRQLQAFRVLGEVESEAAFHAQEVIVDPRKVAVIGAQISLLRTLSVVLQPFEQCVQTVETYCISHGRVL